MLFSSWAYWLTKAYSRILMLFRWLHGSWQAEGELHLSSLRCIYCTTDLVASQYASRFLRLMTVSPIILLSAARNINIVIFHGYVGLSEGSCWVWCIFLKLFGGCWMLLLWLGGFCYGCSMILRCMSHDFWFLVIIRYHVFVFEDLLFPTQRLNFQWDPRELKK